MNNNTEMRSRNIDQPGAETARQLLYIEKAKEHVDNLTKTLGRRPTCCVTTFGCQVNTVHVIRRVA